LKGFNSRLDEIQAAALRVKLQHLDELNERRRQVAGHYLRNLPEGADLVLPFVPTSATPVWHLFVVRHPARDKLQAHLSASGIGTLIHYPVPPYLQKAYSSDSYAASSFPLSTSMAHTVLSLPMSPYLRETEIEYVCSQIQSFND
jgi:dTDP-4-amino-4,6-dideoxygalactose transaminase